MPTPSAGPYLVTGALGQIGAELVRDLREAAGPDAVLATDLRRPDEAPEGPFEALDVRDGARLAKLVRKHGVREVVHLASLLSATGERRPEQAWDVNVNGLRAVLQVAKEERLRVFWPSSIAVFGPTTPAVAPQRGPLEPTTMYGTSKVAGELLCQYAHLRDGVDVRSLRYPGLISYAVAPGGGTTDYAVDAFFAAAEGRAFECFVGPETRLPMMYMPDALRATLELMGAEGDRLQVRTSYNVGALSFTARELVEAIRARVPDFEARYQPDFRQAIADSWPDAVDDAAAREDWGWSPRYSLEAMADDVLLHLRGHLQPERAA